MNGARTGTDNVPAGLDYTERLNGLAARELAISVAAYEAASKRVDVWREVATLGQAKPELFAQYAAAFRLKSRMGMGLTIEQAAGKPKEWAPHIQRLWDSHVGKRCAETSRVMLALEKAYTDTVKVLTADGMGVNERLLALPATRARPERKPAGQTDQTAKHDAPPMTPKLAEASVASSALKAGVDVEKRVKALNQTPAGIVATFAADLDTADIPGAFFALIASAKRHKDYDVKTGNRFTLFVQSCEAAYLKWEQADAAATEKVRKSVVI